MGAEKIGCMEPVRQILNRINFKKNARPEVFRRKRPRASKGVPPISPCKAGRGVLPDKSPQRAVPPASDSAATGRGKKGAFNKAAGDLIVQVEESRSALSRDLGLKGYVGQTKDP